MKKILYVFRLVTQSMLTTITRTKPFEVTPLSKRTKCRVYPFYYYSCCNRQALDNLKLDEHKIAKILGNKWKTLSDSEKAPYIRECNKVR